MRRGVELVQVDAKTSAEIPLLVEVDSKCPVPRSGKADGEVEGDRCLSAAALCVRFLNCSDCSTEATLAWSTASEGLMRRTLLSCLTLSFAAEKSDCTLST